MKRIAMVVFMLSVMVIAGCGGSGGDSTDCTAGETAAQNAFEDFGTILADNGTLPCLTGAATTCDCPNGGTMTVDQATFTLTFSADCTSATDQIYAGSIALSQDGTISGNMNPFDGCTNVTATGIASVEGACAGTISGTCASQNLQCNVVDDGAGGCTLECTCVPSH